jgi:GntR family transcriptional regulator
VIHIRRLRTGSDEPLVIASTWLPESLFRGFLDHGLRQHSVYEIMSRLGHKPADAVQTIQAAASDAEQARLLDVAAGAPALMVTQVGYASGLAVEFAIDYYRGDRAAFRVELGELTHRLSDRVHGGHTGA